MTPKNPDPGLRFAAKLRDRLADLRLRVDLGELGSPAAFREALEAGGMFRVDHPRVREACRRAGLGHLIP
jgi:hypothetical protein